MSQPKIPQYPSFCKFNLSLKNEYEAIYNQHEPYSEYNFENLAIWLNLNNNLELSNLNKNIVLRYSETKSPDKISYAVYGNKMVAETFGELFKSTKILEFIPEFIINKARDKVDFKICEDRDNFEYLYDVENYTKLESHSYRKIRYEVNRFKREYASAKIQIIDLLNNKNKLMLKTFIDNLGVNNNDSDGFELLALNRMFELSRKLNPKCLAVKVDKKIASFAIFYLIDNNVSIVSNVMANYKYTDIFDFTFWVLANYLNSINYKTINFEQDLGIEGIRFHKLKLKPNKFLKKYTISLKNKL